MLCIQLPLFPATNTENLNGNALLARYPHSPCAVVRWTKIGPALIHFVEEVGVWVVSRAAGIRGPSGNRAATIQYVFEEVFLISQERKAVNFIKRAGEPWLEQSYDYVMSCIASGRRIEAYE